MNTLTAVSKAIGAVGAGVLLYDAHKMGEHHSSKSQCESVANTLPDAYINSNMMDQPSAIGNKLKKDFFCWQLDDGITPFFAGIKGYVDGVFGSLSANIIPVALATGSLLFKKAGRFCAAGLALCGAKYFLYDVMGIGKPKHLAE